VEEAAVPFFPLPREIHFLRRIPAVKEDRTLGHGNYRKPIRREGSRKRPYRVETIPFHQLLFILSGAYSSLTPAVNLASRLASQRFSRAAFRTVFVSSSRELEPQVTDKEWPSPRGIICGRALSLLRLQPREGAGVEREGRTWLTNEEDYAENSMEKQAFPSLHSGTASWRTDVIESSAVLS